MENKYKGIVEFLLTSHGIDISGFDATFVEKTIDRRRVLFKDDSLSDYFNFLVTSTEEVGQLIGSLHISYSEFFRNPLTFAYLEQLILPQLSGRKREGLPSGVRIWSAACASGQEAYSIAMLMDELNQNRGAEIKYQIFATDNNQDEITRAREGLFNIASINKVSLKRVQNYFTKQEDYYLFSSRLKKSVDFSVFDLLSARQTSPSPSIFGNFDLVFCCNVLFYYEPASRLKILEKVGNTMSPDAFLVTGETERDILLKNGFSEVFPHSAIFQKNMNKGTRKY